jgi:hypothetical protein
MVARKDDRGEFEAEILAWLDSRPSLKQLESLVGELTPDEEILLGDIERELLLEPAEEELPILSPDLVERMVAAVQASVTPRNQAVEPLDEVAVKFDRGFRLLELLSELEPSEKVIQAREEVADGLAKFVRQDLAVSGRGTDGD